MFKSLADQQKRHGRRICSAWAGRAALGAATLLSVLLTAATASAQADCPIGAHRLTVHQAGLQLGVIRAPVRRFTIVQNESLEATASAAWTNPETLPKLKTLSASEDPPPCDALWFASDGQFDKFEALYRDPGVEAPALSIRHPRAHWIWPLDAAGKQLGWRELEGAINRWLNADGAGAPDAQALAGALTARDTLNRGGSWAWLPVIEAPTTEAENSPAWLLFRIQDYYEGLDSNKPVPAFLVHDEQSFAAVAGDTQPVLMSKNDKDLGTRIDKPIFHAWDLGDPSRLMQEIAGSVEDETTARVLFRVGNIRAGRAPIFPAPEVVVEYRQGGKTAGLLSLPLRGSALRAAVSDCARLLEEGAARPEHCDGPPNPDTPADHHTAAFLEAFLPAQSFRDYRAVALPGWLYDRLASTAWKAGNYCKASGGQGKNAPGYFYGSPLPGAQTCAHLPTDDNPSLFAQFGADGDCAKLERHACHELSLPLASTERSVCLPRAGDTELTAEVAGQRVFVELNAKGLAQPFVLLDRDQGRFIAAAETSYDDWGGFLDALNADRCPKLLLDADHAGWIENGGAERSCLTPVAIDPAPARPDAEDDARQEAMLRRWEYDAFRYFYNAVSDSSPAFAEAGAEEGRVSFETFRSTCLSGKQITEERTRRFCRLRLFTVLRALRTRATQTAGNAISDAGPDDSEAYPASLDAPSRSCLERRVGVFVASEADQILCNQIDQTWTAAMTGGADARRGFWRHPVSMVTREDATHFGNWLAERNRCTASSFSLPSGDDYNSDMLFALDSRRETIAARVAAALEAGTDRRRFDLRIGMPGAEEQSTGMALDRRPTRPFHGGASVEISGLDYGLRELVAQGAPHGRSASRLGERPIGLGAPDYSWRTPWQRLDDPATATAGGPDPVTGFRLIFKLGNP